MDLKDTVNTMCSNDYKERFVAEYCQTKIRYERLKAMNTKRKARVLTFEPICSDELLRQQQSLMGQLLEVLEIRALREQITLPELELVIK
ncbi:MAG: hypothetical protein IJ911_11595 [Salinivirgaceae bacterium]|nr:hypothetical protein [Salinivirgaceae bacterium]